MPTDRLLCRNIKFNSGYKRGEGGVGGENTNYTTSLPGLLERTTIIEIVRWAGLVGCTRMAIICNTCRSYLAFWASHCVISVAYVRW
jgi:hypothetical protein